MLYKDLFVYYKRMCTYNIFYAFIVSYNIYAFTAHIYKHVYDNFIVFVFTFNIKFSFVSKVGFVNDPIIPLEKDFLLSSIQMNMKDTISDIKSKEFNKTTPGRPKAKTHKAWILSAKVNI